MRAKKHLSTEQKKYILYLRKESAQESPGASLGTCSVIVFVLKADVNRPVLQQQLNILQMLNPRMDTKLTGGQTSTNRMCFGLHV